MCACTFCLDAKSTQKNQGKPEPSGLPMAIGMAGPTPPALVGLVKVKTLILTCTKTSAIYPSISKEKDVALTTFLSIIDMTSG
jgi:hypothetical protein